MSDSVRAPKQKRSQESLERVLVASTELLEEKGFDAFTVQDASQRADVSVGAIYARFGSKESLLRAVHRHALDGAVVPGVLAVVEDRPAREVIVDSVRVIAEIFRGRESLLRAFMHLAAADAEIEQRASVASKDLARQVESAILAHRDEITHPDPEMAVDVAFRMAFATFARRVMSGPTHESERIISWDDLADEVGAACAAYLLAGDARRSRRAR